MSTPTNEQAEVDKHKFTAFNAYGEYYCCAVPIEVARNLILEERSWQPIDTAPKNKTILLGYKNECDKWRTVRGQWFDQSYIDENWDECDDTSDMEGWYETSVESDDIPNCWKIRPTHWMPLPPAPDAARKGADA